jgi:hypothetical protein
MGLAMRVPALACLILTIAGCLVASSRSFAQVETGRIAGHVLELGDIPIGRVHVTAASAAYRQVATSEDRDGRFELTDLPPGRYRLTVQLHDGGEVLERELTLFASSVAGVDFAFPFDPCRGIVDYVGQDFATSFRQSRAVAHIRILERTATVPHGGECGRPTYSYAVAVIRDLQNPSFEGPVGRSIVLSSQAELAPGAEYVAWLNGSRRSSVFSLTQNGDEEMLDRVEGSRLDWASGVIPGLARHPMVNRFFEALTDFLGVGSPMPNTDALVRALQSPNYVTKEKIVLRFANRRRSALDGRAITALSRELERAADVERRLSGDPSQQRHESDGEVHSYSRIVADVLVQQGDPRAIPALVPFVRGPALGALIQFGGAAVPALVAGLAKSDVSAHGYFRVETFHAFEQMLKETALAATLSEENKAQIRAVAHEQMTSPEYPSDASDPDSREMGRYLLEAAAHLAIVIGDPGLRHEAIALIDNEVAFEARHIDAKWIALVSTRIRRALEEIPASH